MSRRLAATLIALVALPLAGLVWFRVRPTPESELAKLIADLRARAIPANLAEMEAALPAAADNGAPDLEAAATWLAEHGPPDDWRTRTEVPWSGVRRTWTTQPTPEQMEELRDFVESLAPLYEHVDRAADKCEIAWPLGPRNSWKTAGGSGVPWPIVQSMWGLERLRIVAGATPSERLRAIRSSLALVGRLRSRTLLNDHMLSAILHRFAAEELLYELGHGGLDPIAARPSLDDVLSVEWEARYERGVLAERAQMLELLPFWIDDRNSRTVATRATQLLGGGGGRNRADSPAATIDWAWDVDGELARRQTAREAWEESLRPPTRVHPRTFDIAQTRALLVEVDAVARLGRVALAAYAYRDRHGAWPTAAVELSEFFEGDAPTDPFTGAPFQITLDGETLTLRAVPWDSYLNSPEEADEKGLVWRLPPK